MTTEAAAKEVVLIQPAAVHRDELGYWSHPDVPVFAGTDEATEDSPKWHDWLAEQRLEVTFYDLEDEDETHPAYINNFEKGDADVSAWEPGPPEGEGWFLLDIGPTEDSVRAWFARRKD